MWRKTKKFNVLKEIGVTGRAFQVTNDRGTVGHLQRELVVPLWLVNTVIKMVSERT